MAASGSTLLLLLLAAPAGVSGGTFCDKPDPSGLGSLQAPRAPTPCFSRPSSVLEEPIIRKVCDHSGDVCFRVAAIPGAKRGPSHEVTGPAGWGEKHMLKAIYDHVLGGNCTRPNGRRKIVLDVGANIGLYGLYFAARGCFVHFVEALPLNADHVQFSLSLNGFENNTKLHRIAVTAHGNRTIKMRYLPTDTGVSHAVTGSDTNGYFRDSEKNERRRAKKWIENDVAAERLDQELRLGQRNQIDWIKIDVEGSELEALCGATEWLARGAIANLGMELNWKTTIQSQARIIEALLGATKLVARAEPVPGIAPVNWKRFYSHQSKMYMALFQRGAPFIPGRSKRALAQSSSTMAAAQALCDKAMTSRGRM